MAPDPLRSPDELWSLHQSGHPLAELGPKAGTGTQSGLSYYELPFDDQPELKLKYTINVYGQQPPSGFPLYIGLHGGGGGDNQPAANDGSWKDLVWSWYGPNVKNDLGLGVYIAPRGIKDQWDTHFRPQTYWLFQKLLRNLFYKKPYGVDLTNIQLNDGAHTFIDPNRVYLLGFSAGGDGVYRLASLLSDRFAAVNMSAGHPGAAKLRNLANVPICLQVGEGDTNWGHNTATAGVAGTLNSFRERDPRHYDYEIFVHPTKTTPDEAHYSWSEDSERANKLAPVFSYGSKFQQQQSIDMKNTCAVIWVSERNKIPNVRHPLPPFIVWDITPTSPEEEPKYPSEWGLNRYNYWLQVKQADAVPQNATPIRAIYNRASNEIWIESTPVTLTILLNNRMLDLEKSIKFYYGTGTKPIQEIKVTQDGKIQHTTLLARGDPFLVFTAAIAYDPVAKTLKDVGKA